LHVVDTTEHVHVVESKTGFMFRGDVDHCGAPTMYVNSVQKQLVLNVEHLGMKAYTSRGNAGLPANFDKVFRELTKMPDLDTIARFHCLTMPRDTKFHLPQNAVGLYDGESNPEF